jgi:hypothetical protein
MSLAYEQTPEFSDEITGLDSLENEIIKRSGSWVTSDTSVWKQEEVAEGEKPLFGRFLYEK